MHRRAFRTFLMAALVAVGSCAAEPPLPVRDPAPPISLREGRWMTRNPRSRIGHGTDTRICLENSRGGWTITRTSVDYPGVGRGEPTETSEGPFLVSVKGQVLEYQTPRGLARFTFRFDGDVLVIPAVIQTDGQTWRMETTVLMGQPEGNPGVVTVQKDYVWHCGQDPRITSKGPATFPGVRQSN